MRNVIYKCKDLWRNRHIGDAMLITDLQEGETSCDGEQAGEKTGERKEK